MRRSCGDKEVTAMRSCAGKYISQHKTACASSCGLDALIAWHMGVMSRLDATPKPPNVNGGTPSHATRDYPL
ncbi:hypothetical protein H5A34_07485 [Pectobacterium brasiliense]|uniref:hypothetical protein n=1 Tax=Pectobacterium brasiliense TaxID=180957 RepID=UPI00196992A3|nr:hypothetical protein [Pectobacterium brasiliense]MBN3066649.1 hypothetical protein [Pectobacterium brasiliense]MBN3246011.1 hypothetical protein [Pectobacterium brasiliense]